MIENVKVGKTIAALRQHKGMTQQALAASLNVTHQAVSRWENGITAPDMQTMLDMSRLFGVTIEQILTGEALNEDKSAGLGRKIMNMLGLSSAVSEDGVEDIAPEADPAEEDISDTTEQSGSEETGSAEEQEAAAETEGAEQPSGKTVLNINKILKIAPFMSKDTLDDMVLKAGSVKMDSLVKLAPFMSKEALGTVFMKSISSADWSSVARLAPFVSKETLDKAVQELMTDSKAERNILIRLAPFLSKDTLEKLLIKNSSVLDWPTLTALAPFLNKEVVGRIAVALAETTDDEDEQTGKTVTVESVLNDVGKTLNNIGNSIAGTMESVFKNLSGSGISPKDPEPASEEKPKPSARRSGAMLLIAKKAIEERNTEWLNEHVDDINDPDTLRKIAKCAIEADERELFTGAFEALGRDEADEAAALAINAGKPEWVTDELDCVTDCAMLMKFAREALKNGNIGLFSDAIVNLDDESREILSEEAQALGNIEALEELLEYDTADGILKYAARKSLLDLIEDAAENASDDALTAALEIAIADSNWPVINMLTEFMD